MKKFKVWVEKRFYVEEIVQADDEDHAIEIASEIDDLMECRDDNFFDSDWGALEVDDSATITYTPEQDYLK